MNFQSFLIKMITNNGKPELINIDKMSQHLLTLPPPLPRLWINLE
ncbi:hypothetical protein [Dokdonia pacifica]|nr:hypothetical protein [Dokdonia pacifica]